MLAVEESSTAEEAAKLASEYDVIDSVNADNSLVFGETAELPAGYSAYTDDYILRERPAAEEVAKPVCTHPELFCPAGYTICPAGDTPTALSVMSVSTSSPLAILLRGSCSLTLQG